MCSSGKTVSFQEPKEEDIHPATYSLDSRSMLRTLWYTPDEQQHMLREYKMTSEIQILVETLQSERAHRLSSILLKAQKRRRTSSPRKREIPCRYDSVALSKLIVQLSSQRNRISHLVTSENIKNRIQEIMSSNPPDLVDDASVNSQEREESDELTRAKQKFNRLFRQLNRALAAR